MPFHDIKLNDGRQIPQIGFGTWKIPQSLCASQCETAIEVGFDHIDTAQAYTNEEQVGQSYPQSGLNRKDFWLTTKWSGFGKGPKESCKESLEKLGVKYVDLYLIHHPRLCNGDIPGCWEQMEDLLKEGCCKSIGVSNFSPHDLDVLLKSCRVPPAVNQIILHPYVIGQQQPLLDYMATKKIVPEGYSTLVPITQKPGGPVDKPVKEIGERLGAKPEQVLLAWSKAKGAVILSTSSKKERLEGYLDVGDIDLTEDDVKAIDEAGKKGELREARMKSAWEVVKWFSFVGVASYLGLKTFGPCS